MKNTNPTKDYLIRALNNLPHDNALQEARSHINQAIQAIQKVEEKRNKREIAAETELQKWNETLKKAFQQVQNPISLTAASKRTLDIINQMIEQQKSDLQKSDNKDQSNNQDQTLLD